MSEVFVVGAGVIGLSAALAIAEGSTGVEKITVIAEYHPETSVYPPQYTSAWAGAHFRPFPSKNEAELRDYPLSRTTLKKFKTVSRDHPESSIRFVKGIDYLEAPDSKYEEVSEGWKEGLDNFRVLSKSELPAGCKMGAEYDTYVLNAPLYLQYLYRKLRFQYDVQFVEKKLNSLKEALLHVPSEKKGREGGKVTIINCTGQGLQWDGGYDKDCFPIRGQTLLINPPKTSELPKILGKTVTHQSKDGLWTFYIPRPLDGGVILGGTKQLHETDPSVRENDTSELIQRATSLYPELMKTDINGNKYFHIARVNVGFRPARNGGVRIASTVEEGHRVIHGYGCGGSGYEFSWGVATEIQKLFNSVTAKL